MKNQYPQLTVSQLMALLQDRDPDEFVFIPHEEVGPIPVHGVQEVMSAWIQTDVNAASGWPIGEIRSGVLIDGRP